MYEDRLPFGVLLFLGLLAAAPIAVFYVCTGLFYVLKENIEQTKQAKLAKQARMAAEAQERQSRPRRSERKSGSDGWSKFWAWNAYCYQENDYYDRMSRGLY